MQRKCPKCGATTESGEDFCGQCGAHLWESDAVPEEPVIEPPPEPRPSPQSEAPHPRGLADRVKAAVGIGPAEVRTTADEASAVDAQDSAQTQVAAPAPEAQAEPSASAAPAGGNPAEALVVHVPETGPRAPAPVQPAGPAPPPKLPPRPDDEPIQPGDLICGECGAGNAPTRKFCRRCGHDLKEAVVARVPWWRRVFARRPRPGPEFGTRPKPKPTRRWPRRLVAVVAVLGLLGGGVYLIRDRIRPAYEAVIDRVSDTKKVNPTSWDKTRYLGDHPPELVRDGKSNTYWAPVKAGNGRGRSIVAQFEDPFRLVYLLLTPGVSGEDESAFLANGRPERIRVTFNGDTSEAETLDIDDEVGAQKLHVTASDVTSVRLEIVDSYPGNPGTHTAISEVEFYARN